MFIVTYFCPTVIFDVTPPTWFGMGRDSKTVKISRTQIVEVRAEANLAPYTRYHQGVVYKNAILHCIGKAMGSIVFCLGEMVRGVGFEPTKAFATGS
jgi:hypothetical protein